MAGVSSSSGKTFIERFIAQTVAHSPPYVPKYILDVGAGCGTYSWRYRSLTPGYHWTGIEIFEPYVTKYDLLSKYNDVVVGDAREIVKEYAQTHRRYQFCFLGDVLEHMTVLEARAVLDACRSMADITIISIPVIHYPQDAIGDNEHERHIEEDWTPERVYAELGVPAVADYEKEIGVFVYTRKGVDNVQ